MALTKWCKFSIDLRANNKMSPFVFSVTVLPRLANAFCGQSFLNCTYVNYSLNKVNLYRIVRNVERKYKISICSLISTVSNSSWDEHIPPEGLHSWHWKAFATVSVHHLKSLGMLRDTTRQSKPKHAFSLFETSVYVLGYSGLVKFLFPLLIESLSMTFTADGKWQRLPMIFYSFSCNP